MNLIVDSNIVISAIIKDAATRKLLFHPTLELYAPSELFQEIEKHKQEIMRKASITQQDFDTFLLTLKKIIKTIPAEQYAAFLPIANQAIDDPQDAPFAAAAVSLETKASIWSNDKHFTTKQTQIFEKLGVKIFSTQKLLEKLEAPP